MKTSLSVFLSLLTLITSAVSLAQTRDYRKTEEIIDQILKGTETGEQVSPDSGMKKKPAESGKDPSSEENTEEDEGGSDEAAVQKPVDSASDAVLLKSGINLYNSGNMDQSMEAFNSLLSRHSSSPHSDSARMWLGRIYIRKYLYDKAIEQFSGINEKSGEYPAGQYNTALCLELQGDTVSAVSGYQTVAYRFPAHELADNAMLQAGILFLKLQRGKEAAASFTSVLQQYRDRETADDALFHLGKVFEKDPVLRDLERARSIYRLFLKKADAGVTQYRNSPLRERVGRDLRHLEQSYFRMKP